MARPGSKAAKRPDRRRPEEWPIEKYPYMVTKPYGDPAYFTTFPKARDSMRTDVRKFQKQLGFDLHAQDVIDACDALLAQLGALSSETGALGTVVRGVIDPRTRLEYRATITRRRR